MPNSKPPLPIEPITQERMNFRKYLPEWMRQLPKPRLQPLDKTFTLIKKEELAKILDGVEPDIVDEIHKRIEDIDHDLMRLFRERDYEAKEQQNTYRLYQVGYMVLATLATFLGSLQALAFGSNPDLVALFALGQTIITGGTVFLSYISTREPPLPRWMENRRKAEILRREYFRYLMELPPYTDPTLAPFQKKRIMALRAAKANAGDYPDEES